MWFISDISVYSEYNYTYTIISITIIIIIQRHYISHIHLGILTYIYIFEGKKYNVGV